MLSEIPPPTGARILVVDDEPHIRLSCGDALTRAGHDVVMAEDGASATAAIEAGAFDAAVLDIVLPDANGLQLLEAIRSRNADAVVVLVTGFASLDTAMEAVRLGAYEYLRKPFAARDLVRIIERGLERHRLRSHNIELLDELQQANRELLDRQEQLQERMRLAGDEVTAFVELGRQLSEGQSLPETLQSILQAGLRLTHARAAAVYRIERRPRRLRGVAARGLASRDVTEADMRLGEGLLGTVAEHGAPHIENDVLAGQVADDEYLGYLGVQSVLAAPLLWDGEVRGVIAFFDHETSGFTEHSLHLVGVLASQVARVTAALDQPETATVGATADDEFVDLVDLL